MKKYNLYIDFDTILYQKVLQTQKSYIEVEYKNNGRKKVFNNITQFRGRGKVKISGWLGDENKKRKSKKLNPFLLKDFNIEHKTKIVCGDDKAKDSLIKYINELRNYEWVKSLKILLGGPTNFRYNLHPQYKIGRTKPLRFKEIKDWFCKEFKDIVVLSENAEADDWASIAAWYYWKKEGKDSDFLLGHCDKDEDTLPGNHWDYLKNKFYFIDEFTAHYNLCVQCIMGDKTTDNIPGVPEVNNCIQGRYPIGLGGIGPVKAKLMLNGCKNIPELYKEVEEIYKCFYGNKYKEHLNITYKLVHLLEEKNKIVDFPFQL
jgi:hypothetical protein